MDLRDIDYFAVIAEHCHLGRAAEALGLGQPALSMSLRRLERLAQAKLVKRTPKGIELTAVGAALLSRVGRLRLARDDLAREMADLARGQAGHLRIGVSPMSTDYLAAVYPALLSAAPELTLQIIDSDNDVMVPSLRNGQLDLVFNYLPPSPYEGAAQEHVYDDEWVVCASAEHRLAKRERVSMKDLVQERWALSTVNMLPQNPLPRAFQDRGLPPPRVAVEARPVRIRLQVIACSDLLSFTSRRIVQQAGLRFHLKELPVKELTLRRPVGVIYRKDAYLSPAARRFIEILKTTAKEITAEKQ